MQRRRVLTAIGASVAIAGCQGLGREPTADETPTTAERTQGRQPTDSQTTTDSSTRTDSQTTTDSPTETDGRTETSRCLGQTSQRVPVGTSVRYDDWKLTVTSVELTRTYQLNGESTTRTLPDGTQFVIVTVDAVNEADERRLWTDDSGFRLIGAGCTTIDWGVSFPTEEGSDDELVASRIQRIDHLKQFQREVYYRFDPGQTGRMWYPAVTDASYDRSDVEIGSDFTPRRPPTRWVPTLRTVTQTDSS